MRILVTPKGQDLRKSLFLESLNEEHLPKLTEKLNETRRFNLLQSMNDFDQSLLPKTTPIANTIKVKETNDVLMNISKPPKLDAPPTEIEVKPTKVKISDAFKNRYQSFMALKQKREMKKELFPPSPRNLLLSGIQCALNYKKGSVEKKRPSFLEVSKTGNFAPSSTSGGSSVPSLKMPVSMLMTARSSDTSEKTFNPTLSTPLLQTYSAKDFQYKDNVPLTTFSSNYSFYSTPTSQQIDSNRSSFKGLLAQQRSAAFSPNLTAGFVLSSRNAPFKRDIFPPSSGITRCKTSQGKFNSARNLEHYTKLLDKQSTLQMTRDNITKVVQSKIHQKELKSLEVIEKINKDIVYEQRNFIQYALKNSNARMRKLNRIKKQHQQFQNYWDKSPSAKKSVIKGKDKIYLDSVLAKNEILGKQPYIPPTSHIRPPSSRSIYYKESAEFIKKAHSKNK